MILIEYFSGKLYIEVIDVSYKHKVKRNSRTNCRWHNSLWLLWCNIMFPNIQIDISQKNISAVIDQYQIYFYKLVELAALMKPKMWGLQKISYIIFKLDLAMCFFSR